jgi:hypothetical protein
MKNFTFYTHQTVNEDENGTVYEHWLIEKRHATKHARVSYLVKNGTVVSGDATVNGKTYPIDSNKSLKKVMHVIKTLD